MEVYLDALKNMQQQNIKNIYLSQLAKEMKVNINILQKEFDTYLENPANSINISAFLNRYTQN